MPQTLHFNTGRQYGPQGQRISATLYAGGRVTFYDHDRNIDGQYRIDSPTAFNADAITAAYDNGFYNPTAESLADAKAPRGPNAAWVNAAGELV